MPIRTKTNGKVAAAKGTNRLSSTPDTITLLNNHKPMICATQTIIVGKTFVNPFVSGHIA